MLLTHSSLLLLDRPRHLYTQHVYRRLTPLLELLASRPRFFLRPRLSLRYYLVLSAALPPGSPFGLGYLPTCLRRRRRPSKSLTQGVCPKQDNRLQPFQASRQLKSLIIHRRPPKARQPPPALCLPVTSPALLFPPLVVLDLATAVVVHGTPLSCLRGANRADISP